MILSKECHQSFDSAYIYFFKHSVAPEKSIAKDEDSFKWCLVNDNNLTFDLDLRKGIAIEHFLAIVTNAGRQIDVIMQAFVSSFWLKG